MTLGHVSCRININMGLSAPFQKGWLIVRGRRDEVLKLDHITALGNDAVGTALFRMRRRWLCVPVDEHCLTEMQIAESRRVTIGCAVQSVFLQIVKCIDDKLLKKHRTMTEVSRNWPSVDVGKIGFSNAALVEGGDGERVGLVTRSKDELCWRNPLEFFARQSVQTFLCERE